MLVYVHTYVHTSHLNAHTTITNPSTILYIQYYAIYTPDAHQPTAYRIRNRRPDLPYPSMTSPVAATEPVHTCTAQACSQLAYIQYITNITK